MAYTKEQVSTIEKHYKLWDRFKSSGAIYRMTPEIKKELGAIYLDAFNSKLNTNCPDCIVDMLNTLYITYEREVLKPHIESKHNIKNERVPRKKKKSQKSKV